MVLMSSRLILLLCLLGLWPGAVFGQAPSREPVYRQATDSFLEAMIATIDPDHREIEPGVYRFTVKGGYQIVLFNKTDDIQLYAVLTERGEVSLSTINAWNHGRRFSRAYLDEDGDPVLEADLDFEGGVTEESVARFIALYVQSLQNFDDHLD